MAKYGSVAAQSAEAGRRAAVWTSFIRGIVVHLEKDEDLKRRLDEEEIVYLDRVYDAIRALPLDHPLFNEHIEDISKRLKPTGYGSHKPTPQNIKWSLLNEINKKRDQLREDITSKQSDRLLGIFAKKSWWQFWK